MEEHENYGLDRRKECEDQYLVHTPRGQQKLCDAYDCMLKKAPAGLKTKARFKIP